MKKAILTLAMAGVAIGMTAFWWMQSRQSESNKVLSNGVSLTNEWLIITPPSPFKTVGPSSELFVGIPGKVSSPTDTGLTLENGGELRIDVYLTADDGSKLSLRGYGLIEGDRGYISLSNPALNWKAKDYQFQDLILRSSIPLRTGNLVWVSGDRRDSKDGALHPTVDR